MKWMLRGLIAATTVAGFSLLLGYQPVLLALTLLIAAAAMLLKSYLLASRAGVRR